MPTLRYSEFEPAPALTPYVLCYWEFAASAEQEPYTHHVMPDGCTVLAYGRRGGAEWVSLVGPSLDGLRAPVEPNELIWGVRFWPDAAGALLPLEPPALKGAHMLLAEQLPDLSEALQTRLTTCQSAFEAAQVFDEVLGYTRPTDAQLDQQVRKGVKAITMTQGQIAIRDLAEQLGLSERQFQRRFRRTVGLTPKQYARIRRLRSSVANAMQEEPKGWSQVAAEQGYADQAHLIREFTQLTGQSPTTFLDRTIAIEHINVTP